MNVRLCVVLLSIAACVHFASAKPVAGQSVPGIATSIGRAITKYFAREGTGEATEYISKRGGKEVMERVANAAARQGGDDAVEQAARLARQYGPEALAALDNTPSVLPVIRALDGLPEVQVRAALVRLAAGKPGRELAEAVSRHGGVALRSELRHPGVGMVLVRSLGDDGAELASKLTTDQAIAIGRHADAIAALPTTQRQGILSLIRQDTERVVGFVGRFVEANPGKTLFSAAATAVILAEPDRILGGDEVVLDAEGNPIVVSKSGLAGRTLDAGGVALEHVSNRFLRPLFLALLAFAGTLGVCWMSIKLWHLQRREKVKTKRIIGASVPSGRTS